MSKLFEQSWSEGEYRFFQNGYVVDDVIATARAWAKVFGVGPFHVVSETEQKMVLRGVPAPVTIRVAFAQAGPVQIELIQQLCDRPSIYKEWTRHGSASFHQLATVTDDYEGKKAYYAGLGYEVVAESLGTVRAAYVDTVRDFGFYTEIVERSEGLLKNMAGIAERCRDWDGSDPVRLLVPGGYAVPDPA